MSGGTRAALSLLERDPRWCWLDLGGTAEALNAWNATVHAPRHRIFATLWQYGGPAAVDGILTITETERGAAGFPDRRERLALILERLPRRPAGELARIVNRLDGHFIRRTHPNPKAPRGWSWWWRRC